MTDREKDCRRLAELAGWEFEIDPAWRPEGTRAFWRGSNDGKGESLQRTYVPTADARLSAHLAFVGEVAEALGEKIGMDHSERLAWCSAVCADAADIPPGDLAHAAIRVAIAALEARR